MAVKNYSTSLKQEVASNQTRQWKAVTQVQPYSSKEVGEGWLHLVVMRWIAVLVACPSTFDTTSVGMLLSQNDLQNVFTFVLVIPICL